MLHTSSSAPLVLRSDSAEITRRIGDALGRLAEPGDVVLLEGDLGAGKTTFTQGFAAGAGSTELVNSPTFVLLNEYGGRVRVYHADLYRLEDRDEVEALNLSDVALDGVLIVEWPERGAGLLPAEHLLVQIRHAGDDERLLTFVPHGERAVELVHALAATPVGAA